MPGTYTAAMSKVVDGVTTRLSDPVTFKVVPLRKGTLQGPSYEEREKFWQEISKTTKEAMTLVMTVNKALSKTEALQKALNAGTDTPGTLESELHQIRNDLLDIQTKLFGEKTKNEVGEKNAPTLFSRIRVLMMGTNGSTYGPTPMLQQILDIANSEMTELKPQVEEIKGKLQNTIKTAEKAGIVIVE